MVSSFEDLLERAEESACTDWTIKQVDKIRNDFERYGPDENLERFLHEIISQCEARRRSQN